MQPMKAGRRIVAGALLLGFAVAAARAGETSPRIYENKLTPIADPRPLLMYSLPGAEDPIRKKLYRSMTSKPTESDRRLGARELKEKLNRFVYQAGPLPATLELSQDKAVVDYFQQFRGLDPGPRFNNAGFWDLPIPVTRDVDVDPNDVVIYDTPGYKPLKQF